MQILYALVRIALGSGCIKGWTNTWTGSPLTTSIPSQRVLHIMNFGPMVYQNRHWGHSLASLNRFQVTVLLQPVWPYLRFATQRWALMPWWPGVLSVQHGQASQHPDMGKKKTWIQRQMNSKLEQLHQANVVWICHLMNLYGLYDQLPISSTKLHEYCFQKPWCKLLRSPEEQQLPWARRGCEAPVNGRRSKQRDPELSKQKVKSRHKRFLAISE